jgi:hypothetical protein
MSLRIQESHDGQSDISRRSHKIHEVPFMAHKARMDILLEQTMMNKLYLKGKMVRTSTISSSSAGLDSLFRSFLSKIARLRAYRVKYR